jgi:hypothetical protein
MQHAYVHQMFNPNSKRQKSKNSQAPPKHMLQGQRAYEAHPKYMIGQRAKETKLLNKSHTTQSLQTTYLDHSLSSIFPEDNVLI